MVNENLINLINKKPVELVQELKDYEIKTSKLSPAARAKVIKKWGGGYVSENKEGYGPCGNYPVCRKSTSWVDFRMGCLACSNSSPDYWCHARDGCRSSRVEISNKAHIRCKNCYTDNHMANWSFSCSRHWGDYRSISRDSYNKCMAVALNQANTSNQVVTDLSTYIALHPSEFGWN